MKVNQRKQRDFDTMETIEDVFGILKEQFRNRKLYVRYSVEKTEIAINEFLDDNTVMVVTDPSYKADKIISIYGLSEKYLEVDFEIVEERGPGYFHCRIMSARRAVKGRKDLRFKVNADEAYATNFKISKHTIDISGFNIPTSIKVVLDQFHSSNSGMSDIVKVDVFSTGERDSVLKYMKKTGKTLFVPDAADPKAYEAMNDDFIDARELFGAEFNLLVKRNVEKGYKSIITVPVLYITEVSDTIPFAYIQLISKTEYFTLDKVLDIKAQSFKLVDRIRDANTLLIPVHQEIVDISRGGAKLRITNENLVKSMLKSKGFIFDIVFRLQAPITIYGDIKATYGDDSGGIFVGVDFEGNSSRKDEMKRFYSILHPMETDYKARLIKSLKKK
ncbi:MAG: hypothetical protein CVV44_22085 [Spirochaetae bacterium HGW-Spirochaetae-1]|nr:MAG: hypothetical protein CVV44_22085 [Spirochaetae bacterium HGW-Spirochaetae-1]